MRGAREPTDAFLVLCWTTTLLMTLAVSVHAKSANAAAATHCVGGAAVKQCRCDDAVRATEVVCRSVGFTVVPDDLPASVVKL